MANGQPRPAFYVAVFLVILGLVGLAVWRSRDDDWPGGGEGQFSSEELKQLAGDAEKPDSSGITTVKEYNLRSDREASRSQRHLQLHADGGSTPCRFAINVWAGWGPIIYANNGFKAGQGVEDARREKTSRSSCVLIDDPVAMRDAFAAGNLHVGWATLDMVPLFLEGLRKDSRVMPRIYQQVDWSNGGDGIVVREAIKTMADLRGKTDRARAELAVALLRAERADQRAACSPREVAVQVHAGRVSGRGRVQRRQDAWPAAVSWAPDIYNLEKVTRQPI